MSDWLQVTPGQAPLIISLPHTGTEIPADIEPRLVSPWLARKDADWWVDRLYAFAEGLDATLVRTAISRTVIDVNRDPSGASLYPGQATTELTPTTTFDGEPLYRDGQTPDEIEIARRRETYFEPYHAALRAEIDRLRAVHPRVVLYEAHSIRSRVPRLFDGELPQFNLGTNSGQSCDPALTAAVEAACDASGRSRVTNGRFKGGWTTRHYGRPAMGVHALQMELACRGYMDDPAEPPTPDTWPTPFQADRAEPLRAVLEDILSACLTFARSPA
ncbi:MULTISPECIES: N-formylglutamate deformylase [unclassified Caulobacter]|uniref:N-formylglutamate deformylase n=1 Tax=unclassified Caulobacter TaxID=2648921 RepID=UPI0006FC10C2|nr:MULTISPECIES: N-formylglutamate deformylase [unclassified Caulobacter]KQV58764.1 N-formylglutamate deformylase [Caulobacter sp. Root342]KQV68727.1 N-formylglutamate deformylase [Caulobacter sp. Root343]